VVRKLTEMGAEMKVHDPYVTTGMSLKHRIPIRRRASPGEDFSGASRNW